MQRSFPTPRRSIVALVAFVAIVLVACGSAGSATLSQVGAPVTGEQGGQPAATAAPDTGGSGQGGSGEGEENGSGGGLGSGGGDNGAFRDLAKIVYTGAMSLKVEDLDRAVRTGRDAVLNAGGYVSASRQSTDGDRTTASVTYRIPSDRWEETLESLRSLGTLVDEQIESSEVTGQIVDLEARLRNLRIQEASVQQIAEQATGFEEILEGQARLAEIRGQIEQLDAQRVNLEDRAELGTLTVTYGTEVVAVVEAAEEAAAWDARGEVSRATDTLVGMLQALSTAGIWFGIVWLPVLVLLLLLFVVARTLLRRTGLLGRLENELSGPTAPGA